MTRFVGQAATLLVVVSVSIAFRAERTAAAPPSRPVARTPGPTVVRLSVDAAAEPRPALKYNLFQGKSLRKAGNAAPFYYRAILAYNDYARTVPSPGKSVEEQLDEWVRSPVDTLPRSQVRKTLERFRSFDDLREAANREECNWDWRAQDMVGMGIIEFQLREVQQSRGVARWLAVKARLEIAEGKYEDAIETLRIGFQFAHDLGKAPFLISGLVGCAIASVLDEQVHAFIGSPGSPNLYWALAELPRPLVDMRTAVEFELEYPSRIFPFLKDPETALHSPEQWADLVSRALHTAMHEIESSQQQAAYGWESRLAATTLALRGYSRAKRELIAAGYDRAKLEQMPVGQLIAVHEAYLCRHVADDQRKWTLLPYSEGQRRLSEVDHKLVRDGYLGPPLSTREIVPIMSILLPATSQASEAMIRRDISIAADGVIEALRMHAAQNGGKLPRSLSEISVVPVPLHPRFGKPFAYKLEGEKAVLEVRRTTEPPEPLVEADSLFEIIIARGGHRTAPKNRGN